MPFGGLLTAGLMAGAGAAGGFLSSGGPERNYEQLPWEKSLELAPESDQEKMARMMAFNNLGTLSDYIGAGPGIGDIYSAMGSAGDYSSMLQKYMQTGYVPSESDIASSQGFASQIFKPQQMDLQELFNQQGRDVSRQAALLGRGVNDPILRAKMFEAQGKQQAMLGAQQGAYAAQLALQRPQERLQAAQARQNLLGGLATQALQNRLSLLQTGSNLQNMERNFRLQSATQKGFGTNVYETPSQAQRIGSMLSGFMKGGASGLGAGGALGGMMGGGGAGMMQSFNAVSSNLNSSPMGPTSTIGSTPSFGGGTAFNNAGQYINFA